MRPTAPTLALLAALPALAAAGDGTEAALPCRPTIACTAEIVSPGKLELELGYSGRHSAGELQHSTPALLKLTASERVQLQLGTNGYVAAPSTGSYVDDALAGAKVLVARQGDIVPAVALSAAVGIPALRQVRSLAATLAGQAIAYASKDVAGFHADLNVGGNLVALDAVRRVQPFAALAVSRDVGGGLTPMVEAYAFRAAPPLASSDHGLLAAIGWSPRPDVVLDVGGDWGMGGQDRRFTVFAGVTILAPRLWGR